MSDYSPEVPGEKVIPKNVLIVDDNSLAANGIANLLRALGWNADAVYSAKDAYVYLADKDVDVIILDIGMPEMDGYEFVSVLRNEMQLTLPIVALSGYSLPEDLQKMSEAGFTSHLTKPIGMRELQAKLAELL